MATAAPATNDRPTGPAVAPGTAAPVPLVDEAAPDAADELAVPVPEALLPDSEAVAVPEAEPEVAVEKPDCVETGLGVVAGVGTTTGEVSPAGIEAAPGCEVTTAG
jgi:hypothetical protein